MRIVPRYLSLSLWILFLGCGGRAETSAAGADVRTEGPEGAKKDDGVTSPPSGAASENCVEGLDGASMVRGLRPERDVDAVVFVALDGEHYVALVIEQFGEPCEPVAVGSSCIVALEERQVGFYTIGMDVPRALIVSENGELESLGYVALREFLGEVDTPNEAAVLAWSEGWEVPCPNIMAADESWVLVPEDAECTDGEGWIAVSRDGRVSHSAHCQVGVP